MIQITGRRQLVPAARCRAADRGEVALAGILARILDREPGLVGEFAEIDLVLSASPVAKCGDVGAGAEDIVFARTDHDRLHLGMLEAQALHRVGELDIDAEVVGIELELGARKKAARGVDVEGEGGDRAVGREPPMAIARGVGLGN